MKARSLSPGFFRQNRRRLLEIMEPGTMAVISAAGPKLRNGDQHYTYRQDSDFFYLTGMEIPDCTLVLLKPGSAGHETERLFIHQPSEKEGLWEGRTMDLEKARLISAAASLAWMDELDEFLSSCIPVFTEVYSSLGTADDVLTHLVDYRLMEAMKQRFPSLHLRKLAPLMTRLRMRKSDEEILAMRTACDITGGSFKRVVGRIEPGMWEYQIAAKLGAAFFHAGAGAHAFEPIVASGKNALVLHYTAHSSRCQKDELVLLDFGAEWNNYAADCSRTVPVSGRFSARQRKVYQGLLGVFYQARALMTRGTLMRDFHHQVCEMMEDFHIGLGLYTSEEAKRAPETAPLWKRYYMHGTSHSIGLDVHDRFDRSIAFEPGMVFSCEPAIYIPEEGLGIRIENDILIGEEGPIDLMADIPLDADELEALMNA